MYNSLLLIILHPSFKIHLSIHIFNSSNVNGATINIIGGTCAYLKKRKINLIHIFVNIFFSNPRTRNHALTNNLYINPEKWTIIWIQTEINVSTKVRSKSIKIILEIIGIHYIKKIEFLRKTNQQTKNTFCCFFFSCW